jgi:hypothetical protein
MAIQHNVILNHFLDLGGGQLIRRRQLAIEVLRPCLVDIEGWRL